MDCGAVACCIRQASTQSGRGTWLLVVIDEYTRECLAIEVGRSFTAEDVVGVLQYLFAVRRTPEYIRSDNGPEFVSKEICQWLKQADVKTLFIAKAAHGRTATSNRSMARFAMSC